MGDPHHYSVTVDESVFGFSGFGTVRVPSVHNSPSKTGVSVVDPVPCEATVVNTATVTAETGSGTILKASDTATVAIVTGPLGSLGDRVWFDANANGVQDAGEAGIVGVKVNLAGDFNDDDVIDYTAHRRPREQRHLHLHGPAGRHLYGDGGHRDAARELHRDLRPGWPGNPEQGHRHLGGRAEPHGLRLRLRGLGPRLLAGENRQQDRRWRSARQVTYTYVVTNTGTHRADQRGAQGRQRHAERSGG